MAETKPQTYHIYGRKTYPQPLEYVDKLSIDAENTLEQATRQHTEDGWVELVAIPETAIIQVISEGQGVA